MTSLVLIVGAWLFISALAGLVVGGAIRSAGELPVPTDEDRTHGDQHDSERPLAALARH